MLETTLNKRDAMLKQFRRVGWSASRRPVPRAPRIEPVERERAIEAFDEGEFEVALAILNRHAAAIIEDPGCLNLRAMASAALRRPDEEIDARLDEAERGAKQLLAGVFVNRAAVEKGRRRYDQALAAGLEARRLCSHWYAPHLAIIAVLEHRNDTGDREEVIEAARRMRHSVRDWTDALGDLSTDVEFERLRSDAALFEQLFGDRPTI